MGSTSPICWRTVCFSLQANMNSVKCKSYFVIWNIGHIIIERTRFAPQFMTYVYIKFGSVHCNNVIFVTAKRVTREMWIEWTRRNPKICQQLSNTILKTIWTNIVTMNKAQQPKISQQLSNNILKIEQYTILMCVTSKSATLLNEHLMKCKPTTTVQRAVLSKRTTQQINWEHASQLILHKLYNQKSQLHKATSWASHTYQTIIRTAQVKRFVAEVSIATILKGG